MWRRSTESVRRDARCTGCISCEPWITRSYRNINGCDWIRSNKNAFVAPHKFIHFIIASGSTTDAVWHTLTDWHDVISAKIEFCVHEHVSLLLILLKTHTHELRRLLKPSKRCHNRAGESIGEQKLFNKLCIDLHRPRLKSTNLLTAFSLGQWNSVWQPNSFHG